MRGKGFEFLAGDFVVFDLDSLEHFHAFFWGKAGETDAVDFKRIHFDIRICDCRLGGGGIGDAQRCFQGHQLVPFFARGLFATQDDGVDGIIFETHGSVWAGIGGNQNIGVSAIFRFFSFVQKVA